MAGFNRPNRPRPLSPRRPTPSPWILPLSLKRSRNCSASPRTRAISLTTTSTTPCPDEVVTPELLDAIYSKLRGFEVEIVEAPDLERPKPRRTGGGSGGKPPGYPGRPRPDVPAPNGQSPLAHPRTGSARFASASRKAKPRRAASCLASALPARNTSPWPRNCSPIRPANALTASLLTKKSKAAPPI